MHQFLYDYMFIHIDIVDNNLMILRLYSVLGGSFLEGIFFLQLELFPKMLIHSENAQVR
jgi:hypothetical protein